MYQRPAWVRRINDMGESVGGAGNLVPLDPAELVATARDSLGLADFADDDGWRERFTALVETIESEDNLTTVGRLMTRDELLRALRTRLLVRAARTDSPGIDDERIEAPLVIAGPARSGTTILFELLALDPQLRAPLAWEAIHPVPLPDTHAPRERLAEAEQDFWADVQPEFDAVHELRAALPVECVTLMLPAFGDGHWSMVLWAPGWSGGVTASYDFHRRMLQVLQHAGDDRRWVLKTPLHLLNLGQLFATYPDAQVIHTHRDPVKTIPSTASTVAMMFWLRSSATVEKELLALGINEAFKAAMLGAMEGRADGTYPAGQIVDLHFQDLLSDPVATLAATYESLGRDFTPAFEDRAVRYLADKPQGKHGRHAYRAEDWGLSDASIRRDYQAYTDHYGVALEA